MGAAESCVAETGLDCAPCQGSDGGRQHGGVSMDRVSNGRDRVSKVRASHGNQTLVDRLCSYAETDDHTAIGLLCTYMGAAECINMCNDKGMTALHVAARSGSLQSFKELLLRGADPNASTSDGRTYDDLVVPSDMNSKQILEVGRKNRLMRKELIGMAAATGPVSGSGRGAQRGEYRDAPGRELVDGSPKRGMGGGAVVRKSSGFFADSGSPQHQNPPSFQPPNAAARTNGVQSSHSASPERDAPAAKPASTHVTYSQASNGPHRQGVVEGGEGGARRGGHVGMAEENIIPGLPPPPEAALRRSSQPEAGLRRPPQLQLDSFAKAAQQGDGAGRFPEPEAGASVVEANSLSSKHWSPRHANTSPLASPSSSSRSLLQDLNQATIASIEAPTAATTTTTTTTRAAPAPAPLSPSSSPGSTNHAPASSPPSFPSPARPAYSTSHTQDASQRAQDIGASGSVAYAPASAQSQMKSSEYRIRGPSETRVIPLVVDDALTLRIGSPQSQSPQKPRVIRQPTSVPDENVQPPSSPSTGSVGRAADAQNSAAEDKAKSTRIDALIEKAQSARADVLNSSATAEIHVMPPRQAQQPPQQAQQPPQQAQQPPQLAQHESPLSPKAAEAVSALPGLLASLSSKAESHGKRRVSKDAYAIPEDEEFHGLPLLKEALDNDQEEVMLLPDGSSRKVIMVERRNAIGTVSLVQGKAGVGVSLGSTAEGEIFVTGLAPGGPAETCKKLVVGDQVLAIDRIDVSGLDVAQVVKLVVGVEGTVVRLDIRSAPPVYGVSARGAGTSSSPVEELV